MYPLYFVYNFSKALIRYALYSAIFTTAIFSFISDVRNAVDISLIIAVFDKRLTVIAYSNTSNRDNDQRVKKKNSILSHIDLYRFLKNIFTKKF